MGTTVDSPQRPSLFLESTFEAVANGSALVLIEDRCGHSGADLVAAAALITTRRMSFIVRYTSGFVTVAVPEERCNQLGLPPVANNVTDWKTPTHAIAVDATAGTGTGISARDRACTARTLADPWAVSSDLRRPGHLVAHRVPRHAYRQGVADLVSSGLFLCSSAGFPASVRSELVYDDGECMNAVDAFEFARQHDLVAVLMSDMLREVNPSALPGGDTGP